MEDMHTQFARHGFVRLDGAIPPRLIAELRAAVEPALALRDEGATRCQSILQPRYFAPCLLEFLNLPALNRAAQAIIGRDDLVAGGLALQIGSAKQMWCGWHRDHGEDCPELPRRFALPNITIQTNCALYDDASLWIIPGSHRRPSTAAELTHARDGAPELMPGAVNVRLSPGDCLLYQPIIWHAAEYRPEWKRATFHGGWSDPELIHRFETLRWGFDKHPSLVGSSHLGDPGPYFGLQLERWRAAARQYAPAAASA